MTDAEYRAKLRAQLDNLMVSLDFIGSLTGEVVWNPGPAAESSAARIIRQLDKTFKGSLFLSYRKADIALARTFMRAFHGVHPF